MRHAGKATGIAKARGGRGATAMVTAGGQNVGMLVLADCRSPCTNSAFRMLLDRAGLLAIHDEDADGTYRLTFAGSPLALRAGAEIVGSAMTCDAACSWTAIGNVSREPPVESQAFVLSLDRRGPDQAARVRDVQRLCAAAAMIAELCGAQRLFWSPAALWSPVAALVRAVAVTEHQGLPPIMHLVAFLQDGDAVVTRGLAYFCDVELRLTANIGLSLPEMVRRLARLAVHAMILGPLHHGAIVPGIEVGERLVVGRARATSSATMIDVTVRHAK